MGCKASTIRDEPNVNATKGMKQAKSVSPVRARKSASPVRAAAATPKAATPKQAEEPAVAPVMEEVREPSPIAVAATETEQIVAEESVVLPEMTEIAETAVDAPTPDAAVADEAATPKNEEVAAPAPVEAEPVVVAAAAAPVAAEPAKPKKRRNSKKQQQQQFADAENVAPAVAAMKKAEIAPTTNNNTSSAPKRAFGSPLASNNGAANLKVGAPAVADETPSKKAVSFTANTISFEKKMEAPIVSRKAKKNVGVRSQTGKANMQMEMYLQQCAAFERLLTNANTFEKQMNSR